MSNANLSKAELKDLVETLGKLPRFASCSKGDLETLAKAARLSSVPANWPLINEQTPSDACYVILDGDLEVLLLNDRVLRRFTRVADHRR